MALHEAVRVERCNLLQEVVGVHQLVRDEPHQRAGVLGRDQLRRHAPQQQELVIDPGDLAFAGDHDDSVRRRFQRGVQEGDGQPPAGVGVVPVLGVADSYRHGRAGVDTHQRTRDLQGEFRAVPVPSGGGERPASGLALAAQPAKDSEEAAAGFLREQDGVLNAEEFLPGVAEQPFRGRIHEGDGPVRGQQQKRIRTLLQQDFTKSSSHDDTGPQATEVHFSDDVPGRGARINAFP